MPGEVDGFAGFLFAEQGRLLTAFEEYDGGGLFERRAWRREGLGHGVVGILEGGAVFERAAVNVSDVSGRQVPEAITANSLHDWSAEHPLADYESWKASCDEYFRIPHRQEMRGLGGIFFDRLTGDFTACRQLVADGIKTVLPAYRPILDLRRHLPYGARERDWQLHRRGRYVEFNLTYDRGTRFGLQTKGNIEAILISLPPMAGWSYDVTPEPGSPEDATLALLQPRDWLSTQK